MGTQYQSIGDSTLLLSWSHIQVTSSKVFKKACGLWYIPTILSLVYPHSDSHISIPCDANPYTQVPYILPCSRIHGFFRCYLGVPGKSTAWDVVNSSWPSEAPRNFLLLQMVTHHRKLRDTSSGSSAYSDNHVHTSALSSCWEWGKYSVFSIFADSALGLGTVCSGPQTYLGVFIIILYPDVLWMVWARTPRNKLSFQLSSLPLWACPSFASRDLLWS